MSDSVRVRFAPSPTGYLHVGGARTALFNWLFARQQGGVFILRLEDTDLGRNTPQARQTILDGLHWLGLDPDEGPEQGGPAGPYSQSERASIYAAAIDELEASDSVYPCFCSRERLQESRARQREQRQPSRSDPICRELPREQAAWRVAAGESHTWRLKVPEQGETAIDDMIRGRVTVANTDIDDLILVRADGTAVYNLAVVADDHQMRISHVLRGEDHLTNTFKQVLLYQALGWEPPTFAHLPLILAPAGEGKLSKRKHPEAALEHYQACGYHPDAVVNWLALIGWSYDDKTEIMTREELIERFSIERINRSGARLPLEKLAHLSGDYIRRMPLGSLVPEISVRLEQTGLVASPPSTEEARKVREIARIEQERIRTFRDPVESDTWAFRPVTDLDPKAAKSLAGAGVGEILRAWADTLPDPLPDAVELEALARGFCEQRGLGFGHLVHPVRAALTGRSSGPPLFDCLHVLGREEARRRLVAAAGRAAAGGGAA